MNFLFKCPKCQKKWTLSDIAPSLQDFGFINLVSRDDEIIAFNCPTTGCDYLIRDTTAPGISMQFHLALSSELNSSDFPNPHDKFKYLSSLPFPKESSGVLASSNVLEAVTSLWELGNDLASYDKILDEDFYISFNNVFRNSGYDPERINPAFNNGSRVWRYKKKSIEMLFDLESSNKYRLFPRYVSGRKIFELLDKLSREYFSETNSLIEFVTRNEMWFAGEIEEGDNRSLSRQQYNYYALRAPAIFYEILSADLVEGFEDRMYNNSPSTTHQQNEHDIMIKETDKAYQEGNLHKKLIALSEEFIKEYSSDSTTQRFCFTPVWELKEQYLKKAHQACSTGELEKKKKRKPVPSAIAKEACRAVAIRLWKDDPDITTVDMSKKDEILDICRGAYKPATIRRWICIFAPNRKPGRRRIKK